MTYKEIRMPKVTEEEVIDIVTQFNHKFAKEHDDELTQLYDRAAKTEGERNEFIWISVLLLAGVAFLYLFWYGWLCKDVSSAVPDAKWGALFYILFTIGFVAGLVALALHVGSRLLNTKLNELYKKVAKEYEERSGLKLRHSDGITPDLFVQDLMFAFKMQKDDANFTEEIDVDKRAALHRSIQECIIKESFSFLFMISELKNLSDEYEYMCVVAGEEKSELLTPFLRPEEGLVLFQGFRDGVLVDGAVFEFVPGKEYVGRASHGDFTFIDEIVAKIRIACD